MEEMDVRAKSDFTSSALSGTLKAIGFLLALAYFVLYGPGLFDAAMALLRSVTTYQVLAVFGMQVLLYAQYECHLYSRGIRYSQSRILLRRRAKQMIKLALGLAGLSALLSYCSFQLAPWASSGTFGHALLLWCAGIAAAGILLNAGQVCYWGFKYFTMDAPILHVPAKIKRPR